MGWTKRQFVEQAFEEIGYASYAYDLEPEQLQAAMRRLDSMMATWNAKGIRLGYPVPSSPEIGDLDEETGVPDRANEAIYLNLALRLAPAVGKTILTETKTSAKMAYNEVLQNATMPNEMQFPDTLPAGQGNKPWRWRDSPFIRPPKDPIDAGPDGPIEFDQEAIMPRINELTAVDSVSAGDLLPAYINNNGDARKVAVSVLQAYMQANLTFPTFTGQGAYTTQYAAPSSTGFDIVITDGADDNTNVHLILTPTAGFATGEITLPIVSSIVDKQEVLVNCTQAVTAFVVDGNGATSVTGAPSTLAANDFFRLKFDAPTSTWYRVG